MPQYVNRQGQFISEYEAFENGILKDGCTIRVPMMLADSGPSQSIRDAERAFFDSAEEQTIIARAQMVHNLTKRGLEFTDADAAEAIREAMHDAKALADAQPQLKREADMAQARADAARDRMIAELPR